MKEKFIKEIQKDIEKIKVNLQNPRFEIEYKQLVMDLMSLQGMCEELDLKWLIDKTPSINDDIIKNINAEYDERIAGEFYGNYNFYTKISKLGEKLRKKYDVPLEIMYDDQLQNSITYEQGFELVSSFFKSYNQELYNSLHMTIKSNRFIIHKKNDFLEGSVYGFKSLKPYLVVFLEENLKFPVIMVHESGHLYIEYMYNETLPNEKENYYCYCRYAEVFPRFLELLFNKYLRDNNLYLNDANNLLKSYDVYMINMLENLNYFIDYNFSALKKCNLYRNLSENILGNIIAYHYYDMYLKDPEKTKYNIEQFIMNMTKFDTVEMLDKFGLDREKILSPKILKKYIKRNLKSN